ncbi:gland protein G8A07 [Aphelenchoides avenae]|nr:gland protein G8A07 [Aphelenchus avenae]
MFLAVYVCRTIVGVLAAALVYWTPSLRNESGQFSYLFYGLWLGMFLIYQMAMDCFYLSMFAFCTQISDPKIGGTYMTLLDTLNNLGYKWPATLVLSVADLLSKKNCLFKGPTRAKIRHMPSIGVKHDATGELVSFGLVEGAGWLHHLFTVPEHRRRGLGVVVETELCKACIGRDIVPYKFVEEWNESVLRSSRRSPLWTEWKDHDGSPVTLTFACVMLE